MIKPTYITRLFGLWLQREESIMAGKHGIKWQAWQQQQEAEKSFILLQTHNSLGWKWEEL